MEDRQDPSRDAIGAYLQLVARLDGFYEQVLERYPAQMQCCCGCSDCCSQDLSLWSVEVDQLRIAVGQLSSNTRSELLERSRLIAETKDPVCPLLLEHKCLLYEWRPIICRTHGLPLLVEGEHEQAQLSVCEQNFQKLTELDGSCVLDLTAVNASLAAINQIYCTTLKKPIERLKISEALLVGDLS